MVGIWSPTCLATLALFCSSPPCAEGFLDQYLTGRTLTAWLASHCWHWTLRCFAIQASESQALFPGGSIDKVLHPWNRSHALWLELRIETRQSLLVSAEIVWKAGTHRNGCWLMWRNVVWHVQCDYLGKLGCYKSACTVTWKLQARNSAWSHT
jgi:hypothetical protein